MRRRGNNKSSKRSKRRRRSESKRKVSQVLSYKSLGLKTLKQSGILDSYQYLLTSLCKYGLPTGDLYEFSALTVLRYEKKVKQPRKGDLAVRMKERTETKETGKGKFTRLAIEG